MSTIVKSRRAKDRRVASARINLRIAPEVKRMLMRAAKMEQVKLTEFMIKASQTVAEVTLADRTRFILSSEKWREFNALLDAPARGIPALRKLFNEPSVFKAT